jgi:predicted RNA-binding protein YlxR (DUF448 family)
MPKRNEAVERQCIVTREVLPTQDLIRFVANPEGIIVPDIKAVLPGRGAWVMNSKSLVQKAIDRQAFRRALQADVKAEAGLVALTEALLRKAVLGSLGLCVKAGLGVSGFSKVEKTLTTGKPADKALVLFHALEAAEDGCAKLDRLVGTPKNGTESHVSIIRLYRGEELDLAFGRENVIHAALKDGTAVSGFLMRHKRFVRYGNEE